MATQTPKVDPAAAVTFDASKYQVSNLMYPNDLMGSSGQYGGNYVIFYINVHEDSFLIKDGKNTTVDGRAAPRDQSAARGLSAGGVHASVDAQAAAVAQATGAGEKIAGAAGVGLKKGAGTVANFATGALVGEAAIAAVGGAKKEYKQMKAAVALYMPNELSVRYSASWEAEALAGSIALASGAENLGKAVGTLSGEAAGNAAGAARGYLASKALGTPGAGGLLSKTSGTAANPKKEQLFQEVDFRTFTFTYQFFPRSSAEARNVLDIVKTFKLHMHPEFKPGTGQFLYIYPSEFDIVYYQNGKENLNLHRHTTSVLTDMQVSYSPQGQFAAFPDGMPTQINVTLTFKELALLSKETVNIGF